MSSTSVMTGQGRKHSGNAELPVVVVVDDDPQVRRSMSRLLRRKFDPVEVETLRETEALLAARPEVALVICDLSLGDGSAIALQRWLAQHRPDLAERLVVITGGASTDEARQFLHQIGERAVSKPPDIEQMLALVERLTA